MWEKLIQAFITSKLGNSNGLAPDLLHKKLHTNENTESYCLCIKH